MKMTVKEGNVDEKYMYVTRRRGCLFSISLAAAAINCSARRGLSSLRAQLCNGIQPVCVLIKMAARVLYFIGRWS